MDQEKETNPIAEIFDEIFTLIEDVETRSTAMLDYLQEQGGVTDEKLAPYMDRAAGAADVRWRAARARMEHLLAPKPKSATEAGSDEKPKGGSQPKEKETGGNGARAQGQGSKAKPESKDLGKELASAEPGTEKSGEGKDDKAKSTSAANAGADDKRKESKPSDSKPSDSKQDEEATVASEAQESALGGDKKSDAQKSESEKKPVAQSGDAKASNQTADSDKPQTQKAAK